VSIEIIAEIAQGYEGSPKLAELLVKGAILANADAIKIQLVYADELCVPGYQYFNLFKSLEMADNVWSDLVKMVHSSGKRIYFDVYGDRSLELAHNLTADGVKISTTDFYNLSLIQNAFNKFDTVFLSTGGVPIEDLDSMLQRYKPPSKLTLMHGFQAEPTVTADNNLSRIGTLRARYPEIGIGFMDHTVGSGMEAYYIPLVAMGLGINCIEKHITLDYSLEIEDFISALSIDRFVEFVRIVRSIQPALGNPELILTDKEIEYKSRSGKVVVASRDLPAMAIIAEDDVAMKRVSTHHSENYFHQVLPLIGKQISFSIKKNAPFEKEQIK
jgi:N,N'-diacetyllegionaminate synthase